jgi:hypothetical protein
VSYTEDEINEDDYIDILPQGHDRSPNEAYIQLLETQLVYGLGRVRVTFSPPDPTRSDHPYPSHSGRVFRSGVPGDGSGDGSINVN